MWIYRGNIRLLGWKPQNGDCRVLHVSSAWIMVDGKKKKNLPAMMILGLADNEGKSG